jgi:hypothetical protein
MRRWIVTLASAMLAFSSISIVFSTPALAAIGGPLKDCTAPVSGNGRAVAFRPDNGHLYYTIYPDTHIYELATIGTTCTLVNTITTTPATQFAALSWDAKRGLLWGGEYNGTGKVDTITTSGAVANQFADPTADSAISPTGYLDGLSYDEGPTLGNADDTIWLSGDCGLTIRHFTVLGVPLGGPTPVPPGRCNTGIQVQGSFLWLGLLTNGVAPADIVLVDKLATGVILESFSTGGNLVEDIHLDLVTFKGKCALWSNEASLANHLRAWDITDSRACHEATTITLAPLTATNPTGTKHCVTATVRDTLGNPVVGATVVFTVTGANNPMSASIVTDANGQATFCYIGTNQGLDTITAFVDKNRDGRLNPGEPVATATKIWTAPRCKPGEEDRGNGEVEDEHHGNGGDFNFDECDENHQVGHKDRDRNVDFQSTKRDAPRFEADGHKAVSTGQGLNNGRPVSYTLIVTDLGIGPGKDIYSLTLSDSRGIIYTRTGTLRFGDIVVHR